MATRTIPPTARTQGPQASRVSKPSSIPRPTFGSTAYRRNDTSVFHTPSNNIMNSANSRDSVPIDHSPSEAMDRNRINEPSPSPGNSLFSREWSEPSVSQEDLVDEMNAVAINRDQDIQIDDVKNCVYHTGRPELTLPADDIWDAEIVKLRSKFPELFSRDDPSPLRRPPEYPPIGFSGPVPFVSGNQPSQNFPSGNVGGFPGGDPPNNPSSGAGGTAIILIPLEIRVVILMAMVPQVNPIMRDLVRLTLRMSEIPRREWTYDPTPRSREELLLATFGPIEDLIRSTLHSSPDGGNSNIQKTLIQSLPKPSTYGGENDMTVFDNWVKDFVRWLSIAGLNGCEHWLHDVVEIPDASERNEPLQGRYTFLQVIAGLYLTYSRSQGIEGLFEKLKNLALCLPTPPDAYNFRKRLMLLIPESIGNVRPPVSIIRRPAVDLNVLAASVHVHILETVNVPAPVGMETMIPTRVKDITARPNDFKSWMAAVIQSSLTINIRMTDPSLHHCETNTKIVTHAKGKILSLLSTQTLIHLIKTLNQKTSQSQARFSE
ncbi:hypothetical protein L218DRAFT_991888 [Marasmius fiardii PR-910]|nr:hypothetical protein L218DRAFT_991888 [Marasmius fiardii PR-910]